MYCVCWVSIVRQPSSLWHAVMQWGQGGVLTTEQPVSIVYVSIHTTREMLYSTVHTTLGTFQILLHNAKLCESRTSHEQLMFRPGRWTLIT